MIRPASITTDMFNYSYKLDMETKLELFASRGFKFIHWCDDWNNGVHYSEEDMRRFRQGIEASGLRCLDVHGADAPRIETGAHDLNAQKEYLRLLRNRIDFCSIVGGDAVAVLPPRDAMDLDRSIKVLESVRPFCEDVGVALAVENCLPADCMILAHHLVRFPPEFIGFCYDSGHANLNRDSDELMEFSDRLKVLHLHDNKGVADDHQPPFWGTVDWPRLMQWVEQSEYDKPVNFELSHRQRYFDGRPEDYLDYATGSILKAL